MSHYLSGWLSYLTVYANKRLIVLDSTRRGLSCDLDNWSLWIQKTVQVTSVTLLLQTIEGGAGQTAVVQYRISLQDIIGNLKRVTTSH